MKDTIKIVGAAAVGAVLMTSFNEPELVYLGGEVVDVPMEIKIKELEGITRYDIYSDGTIYHFWDKEQIETFAQTLDEGDDEKTKLIRKTVAAQLSIKSVDDFIDDTKTLTTYKANK